MSALTTLTTKLAARLECVNKCIVDGCESEIKHPVSGMCGKHYKRVQRTGLTDKFRRDSGSGTITKFGYIAHSVNCKKKQEHVLIAESALGKQLPEGAEVHHVNENKADNRHENLVICPSKAYHKLLHVRMNALDSCGHANYRKCPFCKQYSSPDEMIHNKSSRYYYHATCKTKYNHERKEV